MSDQPSDEEVGARVRQFVEAGEVGDFRLLAFHASVADVPAEPAVYPVVQS